MGRIRASIGPGLVALALLALPAGAGAATTVGSDLLATPTGWPSANTSSAAKTQATGVTLPLTAPAAGVIVQIHVKHGGSGAVPGSYGFRVLSGSAAMYSTTGSPAELPDFPWPANDTPGTRLFTPAVGGTPKGIPIGAGDRLGVVRIGGTGQGAMFYATGTGATREQIAAVHNSGPFFYDTTVPNEQLVKYVIEPDADRDGFGDETQDQCPANAAIHGVACPAQAKKKKCKKKRRSADTARKKRGCKKRKKK